jgi:23S rRNA (uracil1939-C5)-methyltransferase
MEIKIEKLIYGGEGLAHFDGSTVFVPFVLPEERIAAAPVEQKKKFVRAKVERILEASPERTAPPCPHFGVCGGCDYQHIPYEMQLGYKVEIFRETLRRIGRIDWAGEIATHASRPWGYRNRAQWKIRPIENPPPDGETGSGASQLRIGYFRANSTALCAVEECAILSPLLLKALQTLREALAAGAMPRSLREIEAFAGEDDSRLLLTATFAGFPPAAGALSEKVRDILPNMASLLFHDPTRERMELFGPGFVEYKTSRHAYRVGHFSFFQVNRFLIDDLVSEVAEKEEEGDVALDLFAGVGLFSVPLARRFKRVLAVESNPAAARDLEANISRNVLEMGSAAHGAIEARTGDVEPFLREYRGGPALILVDPPRAGLAPEAVKHLVRISPARITYVSCEPPTLARDLAALESGGYEISEVHLFDLFPQTFHMEAAVRLRRRS